MTVYVRWYGKVLEGELLEGESIGMKQVRIPLDGHHPVALFTPEHVYDSVQKACGEYPKHFPNPSDIIHINPDRLVLSDTDLNILKFKQDNWDHERNHLRTDSLDQFYQLWRDNMALRLGTKPQPSMKMEAPLTPDEATVTLPQHKPQPIVSDKRMAELKTELKKSLKPVEAKQLSLFD